MRARHSIMRKLLMMVLLLIFGAIINVAVAWMCVVYATDSLQGATLTLRSNRLEHPPDYAVARVPAEWFEKPSHVAFLSYFDRLHKDTGYDEIQFGVREHVYGMMRFAPHRVLHIERAGWPMRALECACTLETTNSRATPVQFTSCASTLTLPGFVKNRNALLFREFPPYERQLPIGPLWSGFAINTLFYATVLWLLLLVPFVLRRWRRVKRGLCPKCGYPVGVSDTCTECGRPLPQKPTSMVKKAIAL